MPATTDRETIVHLAGRHRLSPALRGGTPALVPHGEVAGRCGWAPFFAALAEHGLAVAFEPDDPGSVRLVSLAATSPGRASAGAPGASSRGAWAEARRFLAALRGRYRPA